jgi:hypothetical protein
MGSIAVIATSFPVIPPSVTSASRPSASLIVPSPGKLGFDDAVPGRRGIQKKVPLRTMNPSHRLIGNVDMVAAGQHLAAPQRQ